MKSNHMITELLILIYDLKSSSFQKENNIQVQRVANSKNKSLVTKYHIENCRSRKWVCLINRENKYKKLNKGKNRYWLISKSETNKVNVWPHQKKFCDVVRIL